MLQSTLVVFPSCFVFSLFKRGWLWDDDTIRGKGIKTKMKRDKGGGGRESNREDGSRIG